MNYPHHMLHRRGQPKDIMLRVVEVKTGSVHLVCRSCGHDEGWVMGLTVTERGRQPCPHCNPTLGRGAPGPRPVAGRS